MAVIVNQSSLISQTQQYITFWKVTYVALLVAVAHSSDIDGTNYNSFSYGISDPSTQDMKSQHETRLDDSMVGKYSLPESDGTCRTIDYSADRYAGFNAFVRKDPTIIASIPFTFFAPIASLTNYAAPSYAGRLPYGSMASPHGYNTYSAPRA